MTDETQVVAASGTEARTGDDGLFCVIGTTVNSSFGRTWKKAKADAVAHARKLIKNSANNAGNPTTRKLYVVQVVAVVEVPGPRIDARDVTAEDLEDATSGE
jgi:hypothetical protein